MDDTSFDILVDIDDCISPPLSGMRSKKASKLIPYPEMCSRRYYCVEGKEVIRLRTLPLAINEHGYEILS